MAPLGVIDMILAIGYRVRSNVGMQFRNWTSKVLKEYMQKRFVMNDERLKNPKKLKIFIVYL